MLEYAQKHMAFYLSLARPHKMENKQLVSA